MLKQFLSKLADRTRRFFLLDQILNRQKELKSELRHQQLRFKEQEHLLNQALSRLEFTTIDHERLTESSKHKHFHRIIPLLTPMDVEGAQYKRFGKDFDGGYVMLDDFSSNKITAAYSFGISNDVSWDESMAAKGIDVYMYDHTIDGLPKQHERFHYFKKGVTGESPSAELDTLSNFIRENGHQDCQQLVLKMDIEGAEWGVLMHTPSEVLNQFSQIAFEFHGLTNHNLANSKIYQALEHLNQTHQVVHIHANGQSHTSWLGNIALPHLVEVTYIRRTDYKDKLRPNTRKFPTPIDQPTTPDTPEIPLNWFSLKDIG
ncbi:FkbM family methyltransferase [Cerasicoccus maritimus]|uniref:FkbM family methyltransferase n=1 Tax=Cerasicoccus maritimus TaxID=490089 RepID=UPI0028527FD5|nr:FkbM family methyltransferase [Cerasicoccus maritimus]